MTQVVVVGGGLVGLATAWALHRQGRRVIVIEKEDGWARHQSGHNSGVIHSGLYYRPGSLKATLAVRGARQLQQFCRDHGIDHRITGKLVVATRPAELPRLAALAERGRANGVPVREVGPAEIAEREPHVRGLAGLWVESTGLCDFPGLARHLAAQLAAAGAELRLSSTVLGITKRGGRVHVLVRDDRTHAVAAGAAVVCAGLQADQLIEGRRRLRVIPFRGEYALLRPERAHLVNGLVYPVPDPALPFLGVHLTRGLDGQVHIGPNAVPATAREGYRRRDIDLAQLRDAATFIGSWRLARRQARYGVGEITRSMIRPLFVSAVRRLLPDVRAADLLPGPTGVRAQVVRRDGTLCDDFEIYRNGAVVHVLNAPSPAATACLAIGEHIAGLVPR